MPKSHDGTLLYDDQLVIQNTCLCQLFLYYFINLRTQNINSFLRMWGPFKTYQLKFKKLKTSANAPNMPYSWGCEILNQQTFRKHLHLLQQMISLGQNVCIISTNTRVSRPFKMWSAGRQCLHHLRVVGNADSHTPAQIYCVNLYFNQILCVSISTLKFKK